MAHFVYPAGAPTQPAAAYPTVQTAYVAAAPQAAYATAAPRAGQAYDSYQTAHAAPQYAYATRTQVAVTPAATYDQAKAYYQTAPAAAYAAAAPETQYQGTSWASGFGLAAAKPAYSTSTTYNTAQRQAIVQKAHTPVQVTAAATTATYVYPVTSTPVTSYCNTTYGQSSAPGTGSYSVVIQDNTKSANVAAISKGYDAALYTAATSYYQQQQAAKTTGTWAFKKQSQPGKIGLKPKAPPKPPQLHYCDVCKISCAGPQTYREHLEGQKHKKKEVALKAGGTPTPVGRGGQNQLRCELCDVTCTGADAYAAHIRGSKHQKVLKLHTKLGKPIPSTEPVVVAASSTSTASKTTAATATTATTAAKPVVKPASISAPMQAKKVLPTPKITFVGGTQLKTTGTKTEEIKVESMKTEPIPSASLSEVHSDDGSSDKLNILGEADVTPVDDLIIGHEYIEEVKNEQGKTISFNCKLCECKFNDPNAKEMHMKGRRHRLQYKKKVDPSLQVEVKPSIRARKIQEEKLRRQAQKEEFWRRREQEERWRDEMRMEEQMYWEERRRYEEMEYFDWQRRTGGHPGMMPPGPFPGNQRPPMPMRKPDSSDDRHVMSKHQTIYPNEQELQAVQTMVSSVEKALKMVSDFMADSDAPVEVETKEEKKEPAADAKEGDKKKEEVTPPRILKGVMRVGVLAKGLLLHGDLNVHLVVLCAEKPTRTMLERVADGLPKQLALVTEEKFEVKRCVEEAAIIVTNEKEPKTSCSITLTSPVMREANLEEGETTTTVSVKDPPDVLDRHKCLDALAALRHAKWFQARANGLQSCVVVIRILRDLCQRVPTWTPLNEWAMELLVEKCVASGGANMSPGDALRRTFECIASGMLLPGGPGLYDPCEKDAFDAAASLTNQEREDITASAQHALRLIAFRQIHKVLGMDPLPAPRFTRQRFNPSRKRRRTESAADGTDSEVAGEKKDKKEDSATMDTSTDQKS